MGGVGHRFCKLAWQKSIKAKPAANDANGKLEPAGGGPNDGMERRPMPSV